MTAPFHIGFLLYPNLDAARPHGSGAVPVARAGREGALYLEDDRADPVGCRSVA